MAATVLAGTGFAIGQQILRPTGANDPQVPSCAEERGCLLTSLGALYEAGPTFIPPATTDITFFRRWLPLAWSRSFWRARPQDPRTCQRSPGPLAEDARSSAGSARLDGKLAEYPTSVFDNAPPAAAATR